MFVFVFLNSAGRRWLMRAWLKKILRFYYSAGSLNDALDKIIECVALNSWKDGEGVCFCKVSEVIEVKGELKEFWARLDKVMTSLKEGDINTLKRYARMRRGTSLLSEEDRREIHRALVKFGRRAQSLLTDCDRAIKCVYAYYALIRPEPD